MLQLCVVAHTSDISRAGFSSLALLESSLEHCRVKLCRMHIANGHRPLLYVRLAVALDIYQVIL